jgi:hypothetical protein
MSTKREIKERIKRVMRQLVGELTEEEHLMPEVGINGTGVIYCYQPYEKSLVKVTRGQKAYIIGEQKDSLNRVLIYTFSGLLVMIDHDELIHTGYD